MPAAPQRFHPISRLLLAFLCLLPAAGARAIDIVVVYEEDERPSFDPDGSRLMLIFEAAATIWEDILEGPDSFTVGVCYQDLGTTLGVWSYDPLGNDDISINSNPTSPWWFDPSPFDDSEFSFTGGTENSGQTLYSDLSAQEQSDWFGGSPPAYLEVGYRGTAPEVSDAFEQYDLLSTVIHELGHELGISGLELDFEFEFYTEHLGGADATVESDISGHILPTMSLMCEGCGDVSLRRKPSMTDILAIAYDQGITDVDLPRNEFLGVAGNGFNTDANWFGNRMPESDDDAYLRIPQPGPVLVTSGTALGNLEMDGANLLSTGANVLLVNGKIHIRGDGELSVDAGGFTSSDLFQVDDATVSLGGGTLQVGTFLLLSDATSVLRGFGVVNLGNMFRNDGSIVADNGTLVVDGSAATTFDLDGANDNGGLYAEDGDLTVRGESTPFNGELSVVGHTARFEDGWTLGSQGHAVLDNAVLAGGTFASGRQINLEGQVDVPYALITADVRLGPTAVVTIDDSGIFNIAQLELAGRTHYDGATITGDILLQTGVATVISDSTIDVGILDLDGNAESGAVTRINPGVFFNVTSNSTETFNGLLHIDGGVLVHNSSLASPYLSIRGTLRFSGGGQVQGSAIDLHGTIDMAGTGGTALVATPLTLNAGSAITVSGAADVLELAGPTTIAGATSFLGFGTLRQVGNLSVNISTTLGGVLQYDWDGSELSPSTTTISPGVVFSLGPATINAGSSGSDGRDGIVNVNGGTLLVNLPSAASWRLDGTLNLTQSGSTATVGGTSPLNVRGVLRATGLGVVDTPIQFLSGSSVVVTAAGDTLRLAQAIDYAGGSYTGAGMIEQRGNATVTANTTIGVATYDWDGLGGASASTMTINPGRTLTLNVQRIENTPTPASDGVSGTIAVNGGALVVNTTQPWRLDGTLNLNQSGALVPTVGGSQLVNYGTIRATGAARINAPVELQVNSTLQVTNLSDTLTLAGPTTYREDAALSGAGTIVQAGAATIAAPTTINVAVFDWDGEEAAPSSTLADLTQTFFDSAIVINSTQIERGDPALDGYDGTLTLRGMELIVNTTGPWRLDGTMILAEDGLQVPRVSGSPLIVYGTIDPQGDAVFDTAVELRAGSLVTLNAGDTLRFDDELLYLGGDVLGPGVVVHNVDARVDADTTISVATLDLDGSGEETPLKVDGGRLTLNVGSLDIGNNVVHGGVVLGNILTINTPTAWTTAGELRLVGAGALVGAGLTANGPITGNGVLKPSALAVNGGLFADGGTLRISSDAFPDLDGASNAGIIEALVGDVVITSGAGQLSPFGGTLRVGAGHAFTMDYDGLSITGTLALSGGTFSAPALDLRSGGRLQVTAHSTLDADGTLRGGSLTTLAGDLDVLGDVTVESLASVTGSGDLVIGAGGTFEGRTTMNVALRNDGTVRPGLAGPGSLTAPDYTQSASGTLVIEINGTDSASEYDQLIIGSGQVALDGTLQIVLGGGFVPAAGDTFKIMTYGDRLGVFGSVLGLSLGPGLSLAPVYEASVLRLYVAVPGDANLDGQVTAGDYTVWRGHFGSTTASWIDGDFSGDGTVTGADYTIWRNSLGAIADSGAADAAVPEPASTTLLILIGVTATVSRRGRRIATCVPLTLKRERCIVNRSFSTLPPDPPAIVKASR